jgi:uncharacterized membrane protein
VPALAWIHLRTGARPLRPIAAAIAAVVLIRLCLNPRIAEYGSGEAVLWNWLWYGYGVPLLSFAIAARAFGKRARDWLVTLLQSGAALLATLLVSLEIHLFVQGSLGAAPEGLLEASLLGIAWLVLALIVARARLGLEHWVARHGAAILTVLAALEITVFQLGVENPLLTGDPVGEMPVLNLLLLAYGVPAALLAWIGQGQKQAAWLSHACAVLALLLAFVDVTLEVRHLYQGSVLAAGTVSDAEWYAYSAAWLVYGAVLLAAGVRFASQPLRVASLVAIVAAIIKVFLFDMEALTGLYRAASFIGLGGALIGVALFYQRVVFARPSPHVSAPPPDGV